MEPKRIKTHKRFWRARVEYRNVRYSPDKLGWGYFDSRNELVVVLNDENMIVYLPWVYEIIGGMQTKPVPLFA